MRIPIVDSMMSFVRKPATKSSRAASREERLFAAILKAPAAIAFATIDGHWLLVNDRFLELIGYTRNELARLSFHGLTHADDAAREFAMMKRLLGGEIESYRIEKRVMQKSGRYTEIPVTTSIARAEELVIHVVDGPRPPSAEDLIDAAVIHVDERGVITGWNAAAERMLGYKRDEVIGLNRRVLYRDTDNWAGRSTGVLREAVGRRVEMEDWRVTKDGAHIWVHTTLIPVEGVGGRAQGYVETITPPLTLPKGLDPKSAMEQMRAELDKRERTEASLREALESMGRTGEETMNELRIMTGALRDEIAKRKDAEAELRRVTEQTAAEEEIIIDSIPERTWQPLESPSALLQQLAGEAKAGTLFVVNGDREKEVFFDAGRIFSCASNDPSMFLAQRLVSAGVISEEQREKALEIKQASQLAMGRILLILGAIDEMQLVDAMRAKVEGEIADLVTWTEGRWSFVEGDVPSLRLVPMRIDVETLLAPKFVASSKSRKLHRLTCISARKIRGAARVEVASADGWDLCRLCFR